MKDLHMHMKEIYTHDGDWYIGVPATLSLSTADCMHVQKEWGGKTKQGNAPYTLQATVRSSAGLSRIPVILYSHSQIN